MGRIAVTMLLFCACVLPVSAQVNKPSEQREPLTTDFCELAKDPAAYNRRLLRITSIVTHGFEDFSLVGSSCAQLPYQFSVWVMYGGKAPSDTMYCCPGEPGHVDRPKNLSVENFEIPLVDNAVFHEFTALLDKEPDTTVRATIIGRFFSGTKQNYGGPTFWGGYGHIGCCSLFVIEQVESFHAHNRSDLDYTAEHGYYEAVGCEWQGLQHLKDVAIGDKQAIAEQELADNGSRGWAFSDPDRVAQQASAQFNSGKSTTLQKLREGPARIVYKAGTGKKYLIIVVTRPYWLTAYAKSAAVVWVTTMIKSVECD